VVILKCRTARCAVCVIALVSLAGVLSGCGHAPEPMPPPPTGSLRIAAQSDLDTVLVSLDDGEKSAWSNPCTLRAVQAGLHKLSVTDSSTARADTMVEVFAQKMTSWNARILRQGPYVGNVTPQLVTQDIDGRPWDLSRQQGKVVMLVFFEHT
jgi:hypothetical protein